MIFSPTDDGPENQLTAARTPEKTRLSATNIPGAAAKNVVVVMFTLAKLAYLSASPEDRRRYDALPGRQTAVDVKYCCEALYVTGRAARSPPTVVCMTAAFNGHADCLAVAWRKGMAWDEWTCNLAAKGGHVECLRFARERGCPFTREMTMWAVMGDSVECLRYTHENGCLWDMEVCDLAASLGRLDCLRYAHENGCGWDEKTTVQAAGAGHLDCLMYAHQNGCLWDGQTLLAAQDGQHWACLRYARANGCPDHRVVPLEPGTVVEPGTQ